MQQFYNNNNNDNNNSNSNNRNNKSSSNNIHTNVTLVIANAIVIPTKCYYNQ